MIWLPTVTEFDSASQADRLLFVWARDETAIPATPRAAGTGKYRAPSRWPVRCSDS